jgi:SAM-dependent methyltransferase
MMFGTKEEFSYLECPGCGCLQIEQIPPDMARHYPPNYYSKWDADSFPAPVRFLMGRVDRYEYRHRGVLGRMIRYFVENPAVASLAPLGLGPDTRILDVGCGSGSLLKSLVQFGFRRLEGVDPYIDEDIRHGPNIVVHKAELSELDGQWDLIMLHHSFEHMPDPHGLLREIHRRLAPSGTCLIRIPLASSYAWEHYGIDWMGLDAPRHFFLHTTTSMDLLAQSAGFAVSDVVFDSGYSQFAVSELYRRGIAHFPPDEGTLGERFPLRMVLAYARQMLSMPAYRRRAALLNQQGRGDQAAFYLTAAA